MNGNTRSLAGLLGLALAGTELPKGESLTESANHGTAIRSTQTGTLAGNPHTHFEIDAESGPTTANPIFASGAYADDRFALHVSRANYGFWLIGIPRFTRKQEQEAMDLMTGRLLLPTGRSEPSIRGYCLTAERLKAVLTCLGRPPEQVEATLRNVLSGDELEIAGDGVPLTFSRATLEGIAVNFRPSDC
jgi:hypothetical protein